MTSHDFMSNHRIIYHVILYHIISHHIVSFHIIRYQMTMYQVVLYLYYKNSTSGPAGRLHNTMFMPYYTILVWLLAGAACTTGTNRQIPCCTLLPGAIAPPPQVGAGAPSDFGYGRCRIFVPLPTASLSPLLPESLVLPCLFVKRSFIWDGVLWEGFFSKVSMWCLFHLLLVLSARTSTRTASMRILAVNPAPAPSPTFWSACQAFLKSLLCVSRRSRKICHAQVVVVVA